MPRNEAERAANMALEDEIKEWLWHNKKLIFLLRIVVDYSRVTLDA
jgi:hypothetical protein